MIFSGFASNVRIESKALPFIKNQSLGDFRGIARGLGRSYGDASLADQILLMPEFNKFIAFEQKNGLLVAEAGISLDEIIRVMLPKGYFLPVTPGTRHVTLGGAVACDVHGKNQHKSGSIGTFVRGLVLKLADNREVFCSAIENADLFRATIGGMGLTGLIIAVHLQMMPVSGGYLEQRIASCKNLDHILATLLQENQTTYSVAWLDLSLQSGFGSGAVLLGEHSQVKKIPKTPHSLTLPFYMPSGFLNSSLLYAFNQLWALKYKASAKSRLEDLYTFFYPLDILDQWPRLYGRNGFQQVQLQVPLEADGVLHKIISLLKTHKIPVFLAVLKLFGSSHGMLSFPRPGWTLALDFASNPDLEPILQKMDELVLAAKGRYYLAKDSRMSKEVFRASYPEWEEFQKICGKYDPENRFSSLLSKRLEIKTT